MRGHGRVFRRKHSGSWWISYYHRGQEIRESAKTTSEQKARALLRERLRTAGRPDFIDPAAARRLSFEDLAAMLLTDYRVNGKRLRNATRATDALRETFGLDKAHDITADRIAAYIATRLAVDARHVVHARASWSRDIGARFCSAVCGRRVL